MCSYRTYVPVIACLAIPGLELKAALRRTPTLALRPAALAPEPQGEPLLGPVTAAAEAAGVRLGMRLGEALATCPSLALVEPDAAGAERGWGGGSQAGAACWASGRCRCRTFGAGRPARLGPGERWDGRARARPAPARSRGRLPRVPRSGRQRADAEARARRAGRDRARAARATRSLRPQGRARSSPRERRLVAAGADPARV